MLRFLVPHGIASILAVVSIGFSTIETHDQAIKLLLAVGIPLIAFMLSSHTANILDTRERAKLTMHMI